MGFLLSSAAVLLGCAALALRPPAATGGIVVSLAVGVIGALGPVRTAPAAHPGSRRWIAVAALGIGVFVVARVLEKPHTPASGAAALAVVAAVAVAEELFFRRFVYGWLAAGGARSRRWIRGGARIAPNRVVPAIVGAAVLFAAVHIPAYGVRVFPLDLAAGLLFGWQRWASGGWTAAALTHAAANVLQLL